MGDDTNWLRVSRITCPTCQSEWHRIDRSPMADDWRLYCDRCGNSVVVSSYDTNATSVENIERTLLPCGCGGRYRFDSPRRCAYCLTILVAGEVGVDVDPFIYDFEAEDRDPTPEECARYGEYEDAHIRRTDLWEPA